MLYVCCVSVLLLHPAALHGAQPAPSLPSSPPLLFASWRRYNQSASEERQRSRVADLPQFLAELRVKLGFVDPKLYVFFDGTDRQKVDDDELFRAWAMNPATTFYVFEGGPGKNSPPQVETADHVTLTAQLTEHCLTLPYVRVRCQGSAWTAPSHPDALRFSDSADGAPRFSVWVFSSSRAGILLCFSSCLVFFQLATQRWRWAHATQSAAARCYDAS